MHRVAWALHARGVHTVRSLDLKPGLRDTSFPGNGTLIRRLV
ncbi:hypothetical protein DBV15_03646 [Temnothorax longispinosus]|uniref:Uncharacterized protein n=1 Tax=Temnothorax longispinosus TaxID=300112 RepID=A0A4S2KC91_9HYME|nr:hypothetical protein DBV15_03646 [Temnothorax longispinosus]